jgi:hypothetical protein
MFSGSGSSHAVEIRHGALTELARAMGHVKCGMRGTAWGIFCSAQHVLGAGHAAPLQIVTKVFWSRNWYRIRESYEPVCMIWHPLIVSTESFLHYNAGDMQSDLHREETSGRAELSLYKVIALLIHIAKFSAGTPIAETKL